MTAQSLSLISTFVNLFLSGLKIALGFFIKSAALLADGVHSGLDVISSFVSFIGIKKAKKPVDEKHPYGYWRAESLAGLLVVGLLFISAIWILYEGTMKLIKKESPSLSLIAIIATILTILVNESMARIKFHFGNRYESLALIADAEHSRADAISSIGVLLSLIISPYFSFADGIVAILVGLYVIYESFKTGKEVTDSLLDVSNPQLEEKIKKLAEEFNINISEIKTRKIGSANFAEIKIKLDPHLKVKEASNVASTFENELIKRFKELKHVVISIESHDVGEGVVVPNFGARFAMRERWGFGPGGKCICTNPNCLFEIPHERGKPCREEICPKCGSRMRRKREKIPFPGEEGGWRHRWGWRK